MLQKKVYSTLLSLWYNIQCKRWIFVVQRETQAVLLVGMGIPLTAVSFREHEQCLAHCWDLQHSCRANGGNIVIVWSSVVQVVIPVQQHTDEKRLWKGARELLLIVSPRWEWVPPTRCSEAARWIHTCISLGSGNFWHKKSLSFGLNSSAFFVVCGLLEFSLVLWVVTPAIKKRMGPSPACVQTVSTPWEMILPNCMDTAVHLLLWKCGYIPGG